MNGSIDVCDQPESGSPAGGTERNGSNAQCAVGSNFVDVVGQTAPDLTQVTKF